MRKSNQCASFILGSVDEDGYPNAKAMMKIEHDGLDYFLLLHIHFRHPDDSNIKRTPKPASTALQKKRRYSG